MTIQTGILHAAVQEAYAARYRAVVYVECDHDQTTLTDSNHQQHQQDKRSKSKNQ